MSMASAAMLEACDVSMLESRRSYPSSVEEHPRGVEIKEEALFMTAVAYPDGYDWKKDEEYGEIPCSLLFFRGDSLLMERPAGTAYPSSSDSDMHRAAGADLYEDYSTDDETVILKNGKEVARFQGRERLIDVVMRDSVVYSLGASRTNGGYIMRKDWKLVSQSSNIQPVGRFYEDGGKFCFSGASSADRGTQWFNIVEGDAVPVNAGRSGARIQALRLVNGNVWQAYNAGKDYCLQVNDITVILEYKDGMSLFLPEIHYDGTSLFVDGNVYDSKTGLYRYKVWYYGSELFEGPLGFRREAVAVARDRIVALGRDEKDGRWKIFDNGRVLVLPEGYRAHPSYAMLIHEQDLYVALVDGNGNAALWENGAITELGFNGYIDNLSYSEFTTTRYVTGRN